MPATLSPGDPAAERSAAGDLVEIDRGITRSILEELESTTVADLCARVPA